MNYKFSKSVMNNIEETYTYSYAKNALGYEGATRDFNPYDFFEKCLISSPFTALMRLNGVGYKRALKILNDNQIPYSSEQQKQAKIYNDAIDSMQYRKSDYGFMKQSTSENLTDTGVIRIDNERVTTEETITVHDFIHLMPFNRRTTNTIYCHLISQEIKNSKEQATAVEGCVTHHISCLIGGAGTGKSYVTAAIIEQLIANGKEVAILAPTHKAKESLQNKLTKGICKTIHSFAFRPTDCDAIVIDEAGMLSTPLMNKIIRAYKGQQLIFVGDKNQLQPVEYGRPFELIQERVKVFELKENHRSESRDIIAVANSVLGKPQNQNMDFPNIEFVYNVKDAFKKGAEVVLTYKNKDVAAVNEQQRIKNGQPSISPKFSVGDKIIATTNERGKFYNGELFTISGFDEAKNQKGEIIKFNNYRDLEFNFVLAYGLTIHKAQGSEWNVVAYQPSELDTQNLAYVAITRAKKKLIIVGDGLMDEYPKEREWEQLA